MRTRDKKVPTPEILSGWKNIARHLGMGVRTVQRYERQMGLPIRRPAGRMRGAVLATESELDAWIAASPVRESFRLAKLTPHSPDLDVGSIINGVEEMRLLGDQMVALRSEVRSSMRSLRNSIDALREDLYRDRWDVSAFFGHETNPETGRLLNGSIVPKGKPS